MDEQWDRVVPSNLSVLHAYIGAPFQHGFATLKAFPEARSHEDDPRLSMDMVITRQDGSQLPLYYGKGLMEGWRPTDGTATIAVSVWEPERFGVGEHHFRVWAQDMNGELVLDHQGTLIVHPEPPGPVPGGMVAPPWDLVPPLMIPAPDALRDHRLSICASCPAFTAEEICSDCGCYMPVKAATLGADCPRDLWGLREDRVPPELG